MPIRRVRDATVLLLPLPFPLAASSTQDEHPWPNLLEQLLRLFPLDAPGEVPPPGVLLLARDQPRSDPPRVTPSFRSLTWRLARVVGPRYQIPQILGGKPAVGWLVAVGHLGLRPRSTGWCTGLGEEGAGWGERSEGLGCRGMRSATGDVPGARVRVVCDPFVG